MRCILPFFVLAAITCRADLVWENPTQDFQKHPEDRELDVAFAFRNTGATPVTIMKITTSCGCTTADLARKVYQPGEAGTLKAKFVFGGRHGPQNKSVAVTTDDGKTTSLTFNCLISDDPLTLTPSFVYWRTGEAPTPKQVALEVSKGLPLKIVSAASSNPQITVELVRSASGATVKIQPKDTSSKLSAEVYVQTDYPREGPKAYSIQVRVK